MDGEELLWFIVAWQFGCTVRELRSRMTHMEWRKWRRFLRQQPDLFNRTDYYFTWLILEIQQLFSSKKRNVIPEIPERILRFRPRNESPAKKETPEERRKRLQEQSRANKAIMQKIRGS